MRHFWINVVALSLSADPVDLLVTGRYVVTMDSRERILENGAVAVAGGRIVDVGPAAELRKKHTAKQTLHRPDALISPGLVNAHTHAPMSLLRGIADDLRLQEWLEKFIFPAEAKNVNPEFVRAGTRLACLEMMLSGTTTYADMYYFEEEIAAITKQAGMRGVLGQTIIRFPVPDAKTPEDGLRRAEAFLQRYAGDPLIVAAVAPHAVYTNSDETLAASRRLADKYRAPLLIHLSETRRENEDLIKERGVTPVALLDRLGIFFGPTLAAHAVWMDEAGIAILAKRGVGVAHCPSSNMKLASGVAPLVEFLKQGVRAGLGTDGVAGSNNDVSMWEEMDLAAKLQKVTRLDPEAISAREAFALATIGGARALHMDKEIGSIEPGKKADLITVDLTTPNAVPLYNVYSHLVYALKGSNVRDVIVNGRAIVRNGAPLTLNAARVLAEARALQRKIAASLKN